DMKKASAFVLISSFLLLVLASACNTSVDDMLDDYNDGFNLGYTTVSDKDESDYDLEPDDSGYDQTRLLFDEYYVYDIGTLELFGPKSCRNFKWTLTDPAGEDTLEPITVTYYDGSTSDIKRTRDYMVYMPESGLETGHTYKLTLTVTGKKGGIYTDSCLIYVVKFYVNY
ncbi:MAG: hypothetical protein IJ207_01670, partial [Treponema sp.]|uniref:hypothetical protein n=1 Tax=Treponema sp. TaxID=166 RepID=UPI0025FB3041